MKKFNLTNRKFVILTSILLTIFIVVSVFSAVVLLKPKNNKEITSSSFVIGKITSTGEFMRSDDYICSNDLIGIDDLTIKPKYTTKSKYQVFFYDFKCRFVSCTDILSDKFEFVDDVPFVEYARIMIIPDRDGKLAEDFKVTIFNKDKYLEDFTITIAKKQVFNAYKDYFEVDINAVNIRMKPDFTNFTISGYVDEVGVAVSSRIDLTGFNSLLFVSDKSLKDFGVVYVGFGFNTFKSYKTLDEVKINNAYVYRLDVSKQDSIMLHYLLDSDCHVYLV